MSQVEHGRANHDLESRSPECLCGALGIKDPMWDRYYCPVDSVWLEGIWAQCWCKACLANIINEEDGLATNPVNEWCQQ
jgi:hypothetical protein